MYKCDPGHSTNYSTHIINVIKDSISTVSHDNLHCYVYILLSNIKSPIWDSSIKYCKTPTNIDFFFLSLMLLFGILDTL